MKIKLTHVLIGSIDHHAEAYDFIDVETVEEYKEKEEEFIKAVDKFNNDIEDEQLYQDLKSIATNQDMIKKMKDTKNKGAYIEANLILTTKKEEFNEFFFSNLIKFKNEQDLPF